MTSLELARVLVEEYGADVDLELKRELPSGSSHPIVYSGHATLPRNEPRSRSTRRVVADSYIPGTRVPRIIVRA